MVCVWSVECIVVYNHTNIHPSLISIGEQLPKTAQTTKTKQCRMAMHNSTLYTKGGS